MSSYLGAPATKGFAPKLVKLGTEVPVPRSKSDPYRDFCFSPDLYGDRRQCYSRFSSEIRECACGSNCAA